MISDDASFESVSSNLAQELRLFRQNDVVGKKVVLYVFDPDWNEVMEGARKVTFEFFKSQLGFSEENFIFVDKSQFNKENASWEFAADVEDKLRKFVKSVFEDAQHGLSKQIIQIGFSEQEDNFYPHFWFHGQNFELAIHLTSKGDAETNTANFTTYFDKLTKKIEKKKMSCVKFSMSNAFFHKDEDLGIIPDEINKQTSSLFFNYTMELPKQKINRNEERFDFLDLKPLKIATFKTDHFNHSVFAPIDGDRVLLLSNPYTQHEISQTLCIEVRDKFYPHDHLGSQDFPLQRPLTRFHKLERLFTTGSTAYFVARSCETVKGIPLMSSDENELFGIEHVLLLKVTHTAKLMEVKQLFIEVEERACKVFLTPVGDDKLIFYIFGQEMSSHDVIQLKSVTVDVASFTQVGEPKQLDDLLAHLMQSERYSQIKTTREQMLEDEASNEDEANFVKPYDDLDRDNGRRLQNVMFLQTVFDQPDRVVYKPFYVKSFPYIYTFKLADGTVVAEDNDTCVQRIKRCEFYCLQDLVVFKDKILTASAQDEKEIFVQAFCKEFPFDSDYFYY